ncbi:hypothetical protein HII31_02370, partial [Pseudocercospora fuligena]
MLHRALIKIESNGCLRAYLPYQIAGPSLARLSPVAESNVATDVYARSLLRYAQTPGCLGACRLWQVTRPPDICSTLNSNMAAVLLHSATKASNRISAEHLRDVLNASLPRRLCCVKSGAKDNICFAACQFIHARPYIARHVLCNTILLLLNSFDAHASTLSAPSSTEKVRILLSLRLDVEDMCNENWLNLSYGLAACNRHASAWFAAHGILSSWFGRTPSCHKIKLVSPGARRVLSVSLSSATAIAVMEFVNPSLQNLCFHSLQTLSYVVPCHLVMIEVRSTSISNVTLCKFIAWMWQHQQKLEATSITIECLYKDSPRKSDRIPSALKPTDLYLPPCLMTTIPNNKRHDEAYELVPVRPRRNIR